MSYRDYILAFVKRNFSRWGADPRENFPTWYTARTHAEIQLFLGNKGYNTGVSNE